MKAFWWTAVLLSPVAGCHIFARGQADYSALRYSASSTISDVASPTLIVRIVATNSSSRPLQVDRGRCPMNVRLFRNENRSGTPVWRSEYRGGPGLSGMQVCLSDLISTITPPGDSVLFQASIPMRDVVGDSLSAGRYYVSAELTLPNPVSGDRQTYTQVVLAAGEIDVR